MDYTSRIGIEEHHTDIGFQRWGIHLAFGVRSSEFVQVSLK
jgi:hypothetical protein